jgi:hypothetical protein
MNPTGAYVGLDVHKDSISVAIADDIRQRKVLNYPVVLRMGSGQARTV